MRGFFAAALLALAAAPVASQEDDLKGQARSAAYDFELRLPTDWKELPAKYPILFQVAQPTPAAGGATITVSYNAHSHPVTLKYLVEEFKTRGVPTIKGYAAVTEKTHEVAGFPAATFVFTGGTKERPLTFSHTYILRNHDEILVFDVVSPSADAARILPLGERVLATLKCGLALEDEHREGLARAAKVFAEAGVRPAQLGTVWMKILFGGEKMGYQRLTVREEKIGDKPGYGFESEMVRTDKQGGRSRVVAKGSCLPDGSYQRVDYVDVSQTPGKPEVVFRETASIDRGEYFADREIHGEKIQKRGKVPEGAWLPGAVDLARSHLAVQPAAAYVIRPLLPFRDVPVLETFEVAARGPVRTADGERDLITVLVRPMRRSIEEQLFDPSGLPYQTSGGKNPIVIRRCTEEEAKKE